MRAVRLSIEAVDRKLEDAAGTLGAIAAPGFPGRHPASDPPRHLAGMILSFAKAMGEFGATITFVSNIPGETQTLPSAIYTFTQVPGGDGRRDAADHRLIVISMLALLGSELMAGLIGRGIALDEPGSRHRAQSGRIPP